LKEGFRFRGNTPSKFPSNTSTDDFSEHIHIFTGYEHILEFQVSRRLAKELTQIFLVTPISLLQPSLAKISTSIYPGAPSVKTPHWKNITFKLSKPDNMATPTLIGMPDPPSNPDTPTEAP
jgi:hypothetical protein